MSDVHSGGGGWLTLAAAPTLDTSYAEKRRSSSDEFRPPRRFYT